MRDRRGTGAGWRHGAAATGSVALVLLVAAPAKAWAHAGERAIVLLLPTGYGIFGGTLAVAASFAMILALPHALMCRFGAARFPSLSLPRSRSLLPSALSFLVLALLILAGAFGTGDPLENPLPLAVWTLWWGGLTLAHALFGNLWAVLNPWIAPTRFLRAIFKLSDAPLVYPPWLGCWPATALFFAFAWFELVHPAPDDPSRLVRAVALYSGITIAGLLVYGERVWLGQAEAFAVFFRFISLLAPIQFDPDRRRLVLSWPGAALARHEPLSPSATLFVLLTLATVSFDGLSKTFWWLGLGGINPLEFPGRTPVMGRNSLGLALTWAALTAGYSLAVELGFRMSRTDPSRGARLGTFVLSILPISLAYHAAHYLPAFLVNSQYALHALNDPLAQGWNLLGLAGHSVTVSFLFDYDRVALIWSVQVAIIVLGHILAVLVAHALAGERYGTRRAVTVSQLPLAILMIGYTTFGLWLLSAPTAG